MGTTGKKFIVALLALAVLLGAGWWLLQGRAPKAPMGSGTAGTVPDAAPTAPKAAAVDPSEPMVDPALLRELSVSLQLVADSLAIGKDPQAAIAMLKTLESRLANSASPTRVAALRSALAADRARIAQAQRPNIESLKSQLERMSAQIDSLPNLFVPHSGSAVVVPNTDQGAPSAIDTYWGRMFNALSQKIAEVVKVRRVEDRQSSFRTPEQGRILTEQLRFRIEFAMAALELRNPQLFATELGLAQAILAQAFDADHAAVIAFRDSLKDLQAKAPGLRLPEPEASLKALAQLMPGASQ